MYGSGAEIGMGHIVPSFKQTPLDHLRDQAGYFGAVLGTSMRLAAALLFATTSRPLIGALISASAWFSSLSLAVIYLLLLRLTTLRTVIYVSRVLLL